MIINLSDVKSFLGITKTTDDVVLYRIVQRADAYVKTECRRNFESAERTEYYDGTYENVINANEYPITAISTIHDDTTRTFDSTTLVASTDYTFDATSGQIFFDGHFLSVGVRNVKIKYTGGYTTATMPYDLKKAVINIASADYIESQGALNAIQAVEYVYKPDLLRKDAMKILKYYKRVR